MLQEWVSFPIQIYNPDNTKMIHAVKKGFTVPFTFTSCQEKILSCCTCFPSNSCTGHMLLMLHCWVHRKACSVKANRNGKLKPNSFL